ncbi:putative MAP kinase [Talaromyces proteolyticus]|uniref:mitogen-activated protein kinase kinase n=1 Tax=Talaromyces proteolyticus TaxID=1131652 RepID=A0AAD4KTP4_9EURO|nr:putative MAP kinase [Talaromyces proteolyticus]KAH8699076.1 putative MAP kinase [Talaromyces proteolyticus]
MEEDQKTPIVEDVPVSPSSDIEPDAPKSPSSTQTRLSGATVPSLRPGTAGKMSESSTHIGQLNAARRGGALPPRPVASIGGQSGGLNQDIMARMKAFSLSRQGTPATLAHTASTGAIPSSTQASPSPTISNSPHGIPSGAITGGLAASIPPGPRPSPPTWSSAPSVTSPNVLTPNTKLGGLAAKRLKPGLKLSDAQGPLVNGHSPKQEQASAAQKTAGPSDSVFSKYSEFLDTKAGTLNFKNKAIIHGGGIEFSSGQSFSISLDEVDRLDELGKGNYGTVYKVRHSRPHLRKPGLGLSGIVSRPAGLEDITSPNSRSQDNLTGVVMAMKEIRLELDEKKFAQIIMELDILHRCVSPFIIDFYGAFFQESAVYICVEYMDGGSVDRLYKGGIPESILRKVTLSTVMGLKTLKDDHNIIHRDVKPTNILANTRGQVKICDFGVSGNLVASIAKTNIGCQSYMAPERIAGGGMQQSGAVGGGTYSVQSDIWSLGLSIIECAKGRYPYPPETYNNIFSQLHEIVNGEPPVLPDEFSDNAHAFVRACLDKNPSNRPSYAQLLRHPWITPLMAPPTTNGASENDSLDASAETPAQPSPHATDDAEVAEWVTEALERHLNGTSGISKKPALHTVALDAVGSSPLLEENSLFSDN